MALPSVEAIPWDSLVDNQNITVSVPWSYPAAGVPGTTGSTQTGTATFTLAASTAPQEKKELMQFLERALRDGRATVA